jgi:hypothetical protein
MRDTPVVNASPLSFLGNAGLIDLLNLAGASRDRSADGFR